MVCMTELFQCTIDGCDFETEHKRGLSIHEASHSNTSKKKEYICTNCGDSFEDYPSRRETRGRENFYCSRDCKHEFERGDGLETTCDNCGEEIYVPPSHTTEMGGSPLNNHFCDKECLGEWRSENWVGEKHPSWDGGNVEVECEECGSVYEVKPSEVEMTRYCSMSCKREAWADDPLELECSICGDEFSIQPHRIRSENPTCSDECHRDLLSQIRRGEDNPAWKGGKEEYYGSNWDTQRRKALERDEFVCQLCGMDEEKHREEYGNQLNVHHIIRLKSFDKDYKAANRLGNLVTLCHACHNVVEPEPEDKQREFLAAAY